MFDVVARTDTGQLRRGNEDAVLALVDPRRPLALLLVADGVGGLRAGARASNLAVSMAAEAFEASKDDPVDSVRTALEDANAQLYAESGGDETRLTGTTAVAAILEPARAVILHAGDSRAYRFRDGALTPLTRDHSWVNQQVDAGAMSGEEAETSPQRNIITRALGIEPTVNLERTEVDPPSAGDIFLLSSDGLHGVLSPEEIARQLSARHSVERIAMSLIDRANARGGPDNIAVALARVS